MGTDAPSTPTPASEITADVVVLGGGPVGENLAQYAIEGTDLSAVIVESELLGGECSYYACIPSKVLLRPTAVADTAAHLPGLSAPTLEQEKLLASRDQWVSHYDDSGQVEWAASAGIQVLRGHGRLVSEREVLVTPPSEAGSGDPEAGATRVRARRAVVLASGSSATIPPELAQLSPWTSRDATGVQEVPQRLAIVGGGVVAVEAATWMAALGSEVTLLVRGDALLRGFEPFAGKHVLDALQERGVTVQLSISVVSAEREEARETGLGRVHGGAVTLQVQDASGTREIVVDEVLAATGRRPRLDDLGLEEIGLSGQDITAAAQPRADGTTARPLPSWLHAVGDASGEAPLTHWGKYRARVIGQRIRADASGEALEPEPETVPVPQVVFTEPQVASVGLTAAAAREEGIEVVTAQVPFNGAAGASLLREDAHGTAQLVVDARTHCLVGATFVGPEASELLHGASIAIVGAVPVHVLRHAVPSFPTVSELWLRLLEELPAQMRHRGGA